MIQHDIVGHTPPISQPTAVEAYAQYLFFGEIHLLVT